MSSVCHPTVTTLESDFPVTCPFNEDLLVSKLAVFTFLRTHLVADSAHYLPCDLLCTGGHLYSRQKLAVGVRDQWQSVTHQPSGVGTALDIQWQETVCTQDDVGCRSRSATSFNRTSPECAQVYAGALFHFYYRWRSRYLGCRRSAHRALIVRSYKREPKLSCWQRM